MNEVDALKDHLVLQLHRSWELEERLALCEEKLSTEIDKRLDAEASLSEMQVVEVEAHLWDSA